MADAQDAAHGSCNSSSCNLTSTTDEPHGVSLVLDTAVNYFAKGESAVHGMREFTLLRRGRESAKRCRQRDVRHDRQAGAESGTTLLHRARGKRVELLINKLARDIVFVPLNAMDAIVL